MPARPGGRCRAVADLAGAGPSTGPMLRSKTPGLVRQELAAAPARKGRRAGQPVHPREISFTAARRAVLAAVRHGVASYTLLTSAISKCRTVTERCRHRARKAKARPAFPGAGRDTSGMPEPRGIEPYLARV
jgi:hypothetical protein